MKAKLLNDSHNSKLLLLFAGWGMDERPFSALRREGYDLTIVWEFLDDCMPKPRRFEEYREICVIAWSFGVPAAARFIAANPHLPLTLRIAVNGTMTPVDDLTGIPKRIFEGTLRGLSEASLLKFYRRMCGSSAAFAAFRERMPQRGIEELADELRAIASRPAIEGGNELWSHVIIGERDAIIPAENQLRAWKGHPSVTVVADGPHLPDFAGIINRYLVDKELVSRRFTRSAGTYDAEASAQRRIATTLATMVHEAMPREPRKALEIGTGTGIYTRMMLADTPGCRWELWDLTTIDPQLGDVRRVCDAEVDIKGIAPASFDLITSSATIQWLNSPIDFAIRCYEALTPGGLMAFSTFGPLNFSEIGHITGGNAFLGADSWRAALSAAGINATVTEQSFTQHFDTPAALLRHLKLTGVNAAVTDPLTAARAARAILAAGITSLTYHPLFIIAQEQTGDRSKVES